MNEYDNKIRKTGSVIWSLTT